MVDKTILMERRMSKFDEYETTCEFKKKKYAVDLETRQDELRRTNLNRIMIPGEYSTCVVYDEDDIQYLALWFTSTLPEIGKESKKLPDPISIADKKR